MGAVTGLIDRLIQISTGNSLITGPCVCIDTRHIIPTVKPLTARPSEQRNTGLSSHTSVRIVPMLLLRRQQDCLLRQRAGLNAKSAMILCLACPGWHHHRHMPDAMCSNPQSDGFPPSCEVWGSAAESPPPSSTNKASSARWSLWLIRWAKWAWLAARNVPINALPLLMLMLRCLQIICIAISHPMLTPGQSLVSDITYLKTGQGWLHLATIIDLATRMAVGWQNICTPV